ncbi:sulfite exporter TauE/SafE family protein [Bifidobacterium pullorum subsp. saeculare]|uniref:Probable membrane transporter protein n=1 Tax=Bifidobacterium pullorum subsp. saeculare TaxID=78257 RepID=A0A938WXQ6_9BIFI|nr:sulfite exporter TauE/SafE family protein [Bifidobacterium pullorum]MBM6700224.1 sulfite exporter TauE/SafE family protein [Bifidobacterium pullorum subsp. saeculare]
MTQTQLKSDAAPAPAGDQSHRPHYTPADLEENHLDDSPRGTVVLLAVGVAVGILSGLFGIGGGTVIVPALVWLGLTQRHAAATSMLAIVPTSISGVCSYAVNGNVDWIAATLVFCGMLVGGQIGSWLLARLPEKVLRWAFVVFLVFVIVNQVMSNPSRDAQIEMHAATVAGLVVFGVIAGILAGLLGIGGGAICVPALTILFGASDLIARGTSLLAMFPNAITTTIANVRRRMVHVKAALIIGVTAAVITPLGTWVAGAVSPEANKVLFALYLAALLVRSLWVAVRKK